MPIATIDFADLICLIIKPLVELPEASEVWVQYQSNQLHWYQLHDADPFHIQSWFMRHDQQLFEQQPIFEIASRQHHAKTSSAAVISSVYGQVIQAPSLMYDRKGKAIFACTIKATETNHRQANDDAGLPMYYVTAPGELAEIANALVPLNARVRIDGCLSTGPEPLHSTILSEECTVAIDAERIAILDTLIVWRRR